MNILMSWIDVWNRKVKQLTIWDLKLAQIWTAAWVLVIVKIFPQIMQLSVWWFVAVIVLCAPYVFYLVFFDKQRPTRPCTAPERSGTVP